MASVAVGARIRRGKRKIDANLFDSDQKHCSKDEKIADLSDSNEKIADLSDSDEKIADLSNSDQNHPCKDEKNADDMYDDSDDNSDPNYHTSDDEDGQNRSLRPHHEMTNGQLKRRYGSSKAPKDPETLKKLRQYLKELHISGGFDIDTFPCPIGLLTPVKPLPPQLCKSNYIERLSVLALEEYNKQNDTKFELLGVEKANISFSMYEKYFITFTANDVKVDADDKKTFQTVATVRVVGQDKGQKSIMFCRLKPN